VGANVDFGLPGWLAPSIRVRGSLPWLQAQWLAMLETEASDAAQKVKERTRLDHMMLFDTEC
jgi:hypothetical protein